MDPSNIWGAVRPDSNFDIEILRDYLSEKMVKYVKRLLYKGKNSDRFFRIKLYATKKSTVSSNNENYSKLRVSSSLKFVKFHKNIPNLS